MPSSPGVYWFLNDNHEVLYVGKAKNLTKRLHQYTQLKRLSSKIKRMVHEATQLKWQELESEFEALLIEAELIRLHQPVYNSLLKDDKSPIYVHITDDIYPRVVPIRKRDIDQQNLRGTILGPFPSSYRLKEVLKIVRKIFPWCNQAGNHTQQELQKGVEAGSVQACFYYHIDQCPGACLGELTPEEYRQQLEQLILFLRGKKKTVVAYFQQQLKQASDNQEYELAAWHRDRIELITSVTKQQYRLKPNLVLPNLTGQLREQAVLHLRNMLSTYMHLPKSYPLHRIEGYDVSNTSGKLASVSMVTFIDGQPAKEHYRLFNIRTLDTPNDYHMMQEAIARRQNHPEWGKPDLLVIDGGKGQLRATLRIWHWNAPVISIAKNPDRLIFPVQIKEEKDSTRLDITYKVVSLPHDHPTLNLVQHIRDESHRFSKKQHTRRRLKQMFE